jgi:hypothetical protein
MGLYNDNIPKVADFWLPRIQKTLREDHEIGADPEVLKQQLQQEFQAAVDAGAIEGFIEKHGIEEAEKQTDLL